MTHLLRYLLWVNFTVKQFCSSIFFLFLTIVRKIVYFKQYSDPDCVAFHGFFGYSEGLACCHSDRSSESSVYEAVSWYLAMCIQLDGKDFFFHATD